MHVIKTLYYVQRFYYNVWLSEGNSRFVLELTYDVSVDISINYVLFELVFEKKCTSEGFALDYFV